MSKSGSRGVRPKGKTKELIDKADQLGININKLINDVLDNHLAPYWEAAVEERRKFMKEALKIKL